MSTNSTKRKKWYSVIGIERENAYKAGRREEASKVIIMHTLVARLLVEKCSCYKKICITDSSEVSDAPNCTKVCYTSRDISSKCGEIAHWSSGWKFGE